MIGIFDSGIGGLTVAHAVMEMLPEYDILYFGDTARTPYGTKSRDTIREYAFQDTDFLLKNGAKLIVMACNTAASMAGEAVSQKFDAPIFEVVTPAVALAVDITRKGCIGVIGTRATINSGMYQKKIIERSPSAKVWSVPCPLLVPLVEEGWLNKPETRMIVKKYLHPLKMRQIDTLILGCTHYPVLRDVIQRKIGKRVRVIDSSAAVAQTVSHFLKDHPDMDAEMSRGRGSRFFVSDVTPQFEKIAKSILKKNIRMDLVRI
jgi:glutamate racemase